MWEYIKFNFSNKTVRTASKKVFFSDVLDNVYYIWSLWLMKQLVAQAAVALTINSDSSNEEDDDESTADDTARRLLARMVRPVLRRLAFNDEFLLTFVLIAVGLGAPVLVLHYLDYAKNYWKLGGTTRKLLQENLMRKFLNYDEGNRANLSGSDLIVCITFDVVELAQSGFMQIFRIAQCLGKLVFILAFQIAFAVIDGSELLLIVTSILPTLIIPFIFMIFIRAREGVSVRLRTAQANSLFEVAESVRDTITNYRLIADYYQRPAAVERFLRRIGAFNKAFSDSSACKVNNEYFPQWVSLGTQCIWIVVGGVMLPIDLPTFLTNLAIYRTIGSEFQKIYMAYVQIQIAYTPLYRVVKYMNMSTDLRKRQLGCK